jgi:hypothetical protein
VPESIALHFPADVLRPLISEVVREVIAQLEADRQKLPDNGKFAFSEEEAAAMLGLEPHVLRDERRRGRISASQIVGRRIRYRVSDLEIYLTSRRINGK